MEENHPYNSFRIAVPEDHQQFFTHFYFAENNSKEIVTKTLIPSYQTVLLFNFGPKAYLSTKHNDKTTLENCLILGPIKQSFDYSLPPDASILVANFKDGAFYRFFKLTVTLGNQPLNPDDLLKSNCFNDLWNELQPIANVSDKVDRLLNFSASYIQPRNNIIERLTTLKSKTVNPIKAVAMENGQTERNLQLNHKKYFGYSAKELNRYQRFLDAILLIQKIAVETKKINWMQVVNECGYYDQSQLIHDFKHYTGLTPTKYLKLQSQICNAAG
jgi:AraC-like DNA-binding protein